MSWPSAPTRQIHKQGNQMLTCGWRKHMHMTYLPPEVRAVRYICCGKNQYKCIPKPSTRPNILDKILHMVVKINTNASRSQPKELTLWIIIAYVALQNNTNASQSQPHELTFWIRIAYVVVKNNTNASTSRPQELMFLIKCCICCCKNNTNASTSQPQELTSLIRYCICRCKNQCRCIHKPTTRANVLDQILCIE